MSFRVSLFTLNNNTMSSYIIQGGKQLSGILAVKGAKNAALPILAACLLSTEEFVLDNVPHIEDVNRILEILESLGVKYRWLGQNSLWVKGCVPNLATLNKNALSAMRASILLFGAFTALKTSFSLPKPGGCEIGSRSIETHLDGLRQLGVKITKKGADYLFQRPVVLKGKEITLNEFSVTATENILLASVLSSGKTIIECSATDPFVQDLAWFLNAMGAKISGVGTNTLTVTGVKKLHGVKKYSIIPDPVEAGTFIILAAVTKSHLTIANVAPQFMRSELAKFTEANVPFKIKNIRAGQGKNYQLADLEILPTKEVRAIKKVHNMPYPGFSADLLPVFTVLMTQAKGNSLIHDWMYEGRLRYVQEIMKMGAEIITCDPHRIIVSGPVKLVGKEITSFDLRAGATLIVAALSAHGKSIIRNSYQVERGYENLVERLSAVGVSIKRVED